MRPVLQAIAEGKERRVTSGYRTLSRERGVFYPGSRRAPRDYVLVTAEKDYWVCWLLGKIFADPRWEPHLVFKGGTSLSKVFNAIQRFSEDIDLSVSPALLGHPEIELDEAPSKSMRQKRFKQLQTACAEMVADRFEELPGGGPARGLFRRRTHRSIAARGQSLAYRDLQRISLRTMVAGCIYKFAAWDSVTPNQVR